MKTLTKEELEHIKKMEEKFGKICNRCGNRHVTFSTTSSAEGGRPAECDYEK